MKLKKLLSHLCCSLTLVAGLIPSVSVSQTIDLSFDPGTGFDEEVRSILIQPDGKILVGGAFTSYNGNSAKGIIRLNPDGTPDAGFSSPFTAQVAYINDIELQPNGQILLAGEFFYERHSRGLYRLNDDGTIDTDFDDNIASGGSWLNSHGSLEVAIQPDGHILVVLWWIEGLRLGPDGTYLHDLELPANGSGVESIDVHCDGSIYAVGGQRVFRYHADGVLDVQFPEIDINNQLDLAHIMVQEDGMLMVFGSFVSVSAANGNHSTYDVARFYPDGTVDTDFTSPANLGEREALTRTAKNNYYSGGSNPSLVKLNSTGSVETQFSNITGRIFSMAVQDDGKIVIGGDFTAVDGSVTRHRIARLHGTEEPLRSVFYEEWRHLSYTSPDLEDAAVSGALADPDYYQVNNLERFGFGLDALSPGFDVPVVDSVDEYIVNGIAGDYLNLTYIKERCPCVEWKVEFSSDLITWAESTEETVILDGQDAIVNVRDYLPLGGANQRFARLVARVPHEKYQPWSQQTYPEGARVSHNEQIWQSIAANNTEPGVSGWQVVPVTIVETEPRLVRHFGIVKDTMNQNEVHALGVPLVRPSIASGRIIESGGDWVRTNQDDSIASLLDPNRTYYLEVTDGPYEGHRMMFDEVRAGEGLMLSWPNSLISEMNITSTSGGKYADFSGASFIVREDFTLDDLTETMDPSLHAGSSPGDSDTVQFLNISSQSYDTFFYWQDPGNPNVKSWRKSGTSESFDSKVIAPGEGLFFDREGPGSLEWSMQGEVRRNDFLFRLPPSSGPGAPGIRFMAPPIPVSASPADWDMDSLTFTAADDPDYADQINLWKNGAWNMNFLWLDDNWYDSGGSPVTNDVIFHPTESFMMNLRNRVEFTILSPIE